MMLPPYPSKIGDSSSRNPPRGRLDARPWTMSLKRRVLATIVSSCSSESLGVPRLAIGRPSVLQRSPLVAGHGADDMELRLDFQAHLPERQDESLHPGHCAVGHADLRLVASPSPHVTGGRRACPQTGARERRSGWSAGPLSPSPGALKGTYFVLAWGFGVAQAQSFRHLHLPPLSQSHFAPPHAEQVISRLPWIHITLTLVAA